MKVQLVFGGNEKLSGLSSNFFEFTPRAIEQHLSLYIAQGLSPSLPIKMKAKYRIVEQLQGNDLISTCVGIDFKRRDLPENISCQADSKCCQQYTYTFFFCHQPPPKKYIDECYPPLQAQVRFMVDQLKSKSHCLFMDNLYMYAMFARRLISCKKGKNSWSYSTEQQRDTNMCTPI